MAAPRQIAGVVMIVLIALPWSASRGANIEKLLMPGPVSGAHAKTEENCEACHDRANRERQRELCLVCHKDVAADLRATSGFHGRLAAAQTTQCAACHSEHRGRTADIVGFSRAAFDHAQTDFALHGAHAALECASCHKPRVAFRNTPQECIGCHRTDDAHHGNLGSDCRSCHLETAWHDAKFDHDKTHFPLQGKHRDVPCAACHAGERYKNTPQQCAACHAPDDVHRGSRGTKCADCHSVESWKTAKFDHAKETGFALLGRHARLACADCHRSGNLKEPVPKTCAGCHGSDDRHAGRFGKDCASCHGNDSWHLESYDHETRHKYALLGAHAKLDCHACHTASVEQQKLGKDCASCHRADDVHGGALGKNCDRCHGSTRWSEDVRFDHDLSAFPLVGLHVVVTCAQCHESQRYGDAPKGCNGCHAGNDVHKGALGPDCAACHSPNGWNLWSFDHGAKTHFPLTGAHQALRCADCHVKPAGEVKLSRECVSCHASDEVHGGQFGRQCDRCHTTITFRGGHAR